MIASGAKFENGVYFGVKPDGGKKNKDAYEAIWEEHEGRELTFPKPRYRDPVMMIGDNYRFLPDRKRPGIEVKHMGTFNEMRTSVAMLRLAPGAELKGGEQDDTELRFLTEGAVTYGGKTWGEGTYMHIPAGATTQTMRSDKGATFFTITLPMVAELAAMRQATAGRAQAPMHA
jgi:hypothetical protein